MIIGGIYSFNEGKKVIEQNHADELQDVKTIITSIDANQHKTKTSKEKTMVGKKLFSPSSLNKTFKAEFEKKSWQRKRVSCVYENYNYYTSGYTPPTSKSNPYREMDFLKNKVGVEVQFGKYAFMVYNVCAKMTIFHNLEFIDVGIEIVPLKEFAD